MKFNESQSYRCLKSVCLWSLLSDLIVVSCFFIGYILTCIVGFLISPDFAQGFGWIAIVMPVILLKLFFSICFAVANGYFAFVLYLEYKKNKQNLQLFIVNKTEEIFNKIIKNDLIKSIIVFISILSFIFNLFISVINLFAVLVGFITFGILLFINSRK